MEIDIENLESSGWNYRVLQKEESSHPYYQIIEVYYDGDGKPFGWSQKPHTPIGNTPDDLKGEMELMMQAFGRPVLEEKTIDGEGILVEVEEGLK